ncbi:MAG: transglutaminase-like cysteine peptidase [Neomegalonema sp.]|nr:transglutaminase-like cysteine peptidase [Neomegalonema sp.]
MALRILGLSIVSALTLCFATQAPARTVSAPSSVKAAAEMREGRPHEGPPAHHAFCRRSPAHCAAPPVARPGAIAVLSKSAFEQLHAFNGDANNLFKPITDADVYGVSDFWTVPQYVADCEDYVLYKRAKLIEAGWPPEAVLIGVVRSPTEGYHAVLIVRTSRGELVLDNLRDEILDWRETGYEWVIRQSTKDPRKWVEIDGGAPKPGLATAKTPSAS